MVMLFSQAEHSIIFEEGIMRNISVKVLWILTSDSDVVTDISYLEGCWHYYVAELNHLSNFGSEHYEKHICERILNLDLWFRSGWHLKAFLIYSSGQQNQAFRFMVGPGHCPMISKYGPSLSKAVGQVDQSFLVVKKSHLNKKYSSYSQSTNSTKQKVHVGCQYSKTNLWQLLRKRQNKNLNYKW